MVTDAQPELQPSVLRRLKGLRDDIINESPREENNAMESPSSQPAALQSAILEADIIASALHQQTQQHADQIAFAAREAAMRKLAQDLKPKLIPDDVAKDGNCLFHSVAEHTIGKGEHIMVRASVVEEIKENRRRYIDFNAELDEWIDTMAKEGAWGDGIAALACSNVYMAPVIVWRKQNPLQEPSIFLADNPESDGSPPILLELDEPTGGAEHYSPLKVAIVPEKEIAEEDKFEEDGPIALLANLPCLPLEVTPSAKDAVVVEDRKAPSDVDVKAPSDPPIIDTSDETCRELFPDLSKADKRETSHDEPKTKKKMKLDTDLRAEVGRISSPIDLGATCCRCKSPIHLAKFRLVGKQGTVFMCNVCNSRGVQLNKIYGQWPPTRFKIKTEDEITEIWQECKTRRSSKDLKVYVDEILEISKSDQAVSEDKTESLPMSVWKARGFEEKLIATWDTMVHPKMGTCYTLSLNTKFDRECEEHKRSQNIKVRDPPISAPATAKTNPSSVNVQSKEERKHAMELAREKIRESKANAIQLARRHKQQKSVASKFLPKVVKAQFNVSALLMGKSGKMVPETDREEGQRLKTALVATDKKLRRLLIGTTEDDLDEKQCDELCSSAEAWRVRAMEIISTMSLKL